jgi:secreted trypsin-like serine protease
MTRGLLPASSMNMKYLSIKAGSTSLKGPGQIAKVQIIIAHDNYTRRSADNDIALLHVSSRGSAPYQPPYRAPCPARRAPI